MKEEMKHIWSRWGYEISMSIIIFVMLFVFIIAYYENVTQGVIV